MEKKKSLEFTFSSRNKTDITPLKKNKNIYLLDHDDKYFFCFYSETGVDCFLVSIVCINMFKSL